MTLESVMTAIEHVEQSIAALKELLLKERPQQDAFTAFLYRARRDHAILLEHEGEQGALRERFVRSTHEEALRFGFNGSEGAWSHLLGLHPEEPEGGEPAVGVGELQVQERLLPLLQLDLKCAA